MKKLMVLVLAISLTWASLAWGQGRYGYGGTESQTDQWARENEMRRQQYEMDRLRDENRRLQAERDYRQMQRHDLERQRNENWSPLPHR